MAVILSDGNQVNNPARLSLRLTSELNQVPAGAFAPVVLCYLCYLTAFAGVARLAPSLRYAREAAAPRLRLP
jgi:hypothetical protein